MTRYKHGNLSDYVVDFRLLEDYSLFRQVFGEHLPFFEHREENDFTLSVEPTLVLLKNVPARQKGSHFREDSYYRLNVNALLNAQFIPVEESNLFIASYDFSNSQFPDDSDLPLLKKIYPLTSDSLKANSNEGVPLLRLPSKQNKITVRVRDIGQGNWNEVSFNDQYKIVYDIGTNLHASNSTLRQLALSRLIEYKAAKPLLILSHWDADHINCLAAFSPKELKECFWGVCCMNKLRSAISMQIYDNLRDAFGSKLYCYEPCDKTVAYAKRRHSLCNNVHIYKGCQSRSTNYSGMSLLIKTDTASALLTGDVRLEQAFDIYKFERNLGMHYRNHLLVAPHHGGRYPSGRKDYADPTSCIAISVGWQNRYGHPEARMLTLYNAKTYGNVHRTDLHGDFTFNL